MERNPIYAPGEPIEFQLTLALPDPASLINTSAAAQSLAIPGWYGMQVPPGEGMEVETFLSNSTYVAGMEYQGNSTLQGNSTVFWRPQPSAAGRQSAIYFRFLLKLPYHSLQRFHLLGNGL
ncbi:MAG: hypothetical protein J6S25_03360 [Aeriscardovia sp.]|nr:hypothetical protein [Aeriscardovia sp.]